MSTSLTCNQVNALLSFYIKDNVSSRIREFIEQHLEICPACKEKFLALKSMMESMNDAKEYIDNIDDQPLVVPISGYSPEFINNLSAYVDNELTYEDNIKFKKFAIANQPVRRELENIYNVKNLLNASFEKTKGEFKEDFSKNIIVKLNFKDTINAHDPFLRVITILCIVIAFFALSAIAILWV